MCVCAFVRVSEQGTEGEKVETSKVQSKLNKSISESTRLYSDTLSTTVCCTYIVTFSRCADHVFRHTKDET